MTNKSLSIPDFLGFKNFSASSLNTWSGEYGDEGAWCMTYLFKKRFKGNSASIRGQVVESAFEEILRNQDVDFLKNAQTRFVEKIKELDDFDRDKAEKEYKSLPGFIESCHTALEEIKFPCINESKNGKVFHTQGKVEHSFGDGHEMGFSGYKDFSWPDYSVDLKTTHRLPRRGVPEDYACQISGYAVADDQRVAKILHLSPKDYVFYKLEDLEIDAAYSRLRFKAKSLENRIRAAITLGQANGTDPKQEMVNLVTPNFSGFKWGDEEMLFARDNGLWQM